ncbi:MAG: hypothetical protein COA45_02855 [Zetaproteobacteria bacterium]|nr:MAG: hypothetical protein COA45_02855 [Zetaproteobacteria bacterium]
MSKGWTQERRKKQAENILKTRPWEKSTGPKSGAGKRRSSCNSLKHGRYSYKMKDLALALQINREFLAAIKRWELSCYRTDLMKAMKNSQNKQKMN